jgi:6-phosphogluconolactonase
MNNKSLMVVGSLNRKAPYFKNANGVGLTVYRFDQDTGATEWLCEERGIDNPAYLSVDPRHGTLYANSEVFGWHEGTVTAYRYDAAARRLHYINKQASLGSITAHNSLDPEGRHLLVANYSMTAPGEGPDRALVVYPLREDGGLDAPVASVTHIGQGPNAERQERSHAHCALTSPDGRYAIVADLGLDALLTYAFGPDGQLSGQAVATTSLPPGAGPRHFVFHPNNRLAVVICELDSTLSSMRYDNGRFEVIETVSAVPAGAETTSRCSDIQIHPNGRFIYGANRGHDSIVIFSLDAENGHLSLIGHHPCGGDMPRHMAIDPSGKFLVVANQNGDNLTLLAIDPDHGTLSDAGTIEHGTPMCVKFMPL